MFRKNKVLAWAFYDWANSAFATTVMAGFFPVFFKQFWGQGLTTIDSTYYLGLANALASIVIALSAPVLGAIADAGAAKKRFLVTFTALGVVMTGSLYWVQQGIWELALVLYVMASLGFAGGVVFYDALMMDVAEESQWDRVSALGYALGYIGGGLIFALNVAMTLAPEFFGLADSAQAIRVSFGMVAVWWAVFSLPLIFFVQEQAVPVKVTDNGAWRRGFKQFFATFREVRRLRVLFLFLLAYWLYIDGVDTIVRMAVDYGLSLGFDYKSLILALLITQFVGFPAALVFGRLGERWGAKTGIYLALLIYIGVTLWATQMNTTREFYGLAVVIGLVQGGIQSLSRSFYARLIPEGKTAEFFGFYNMLGKFAAIIGPLLIAWTAVLTGEPRYALASILILFIAGGIALYFVDEQRGRAMARGQ